MASGEMYPVYRHNWLPIHDAASDLLDLHAVWGMARLLLLSPDQRPSTANGNHEDGVDDAGSGGLDRVGHSVPSMRRNSLRGFSPTIYVLRP